MTTNAEFASGDRSPPADPRGVPCLILPVVNGSDPGQSYTFDPGDDVIATIGPGKAAFWILVQHSGAGSRVELCSATPTWANFGPFPLDQTNMSSPDISVDQIDEGAWDEFNFKIRVDSSGTLGGGASGSISYDGSNYVESIIFPSQGPAVLRGKVDISAGATVTGKHLDFTAPTAKVLTFTSNYSDAQSLADAFNALAVAAPLAVRARVYEAPTGEKYLELYSMAVGGPASVTLDVSASDADTALGFTATLPFNISAAGTSAMMVLPNTGIKFTFEPGSYVAGDIYSKSFVGPKASIAAQVTAATAAINNFASHPFGYLVFPEQVSNAAAATLAGAIHTLVAAKAADPNAPAFIDFLIGSAFHTASATRATNHTNIGTNDADFLASIAGLSVSIHRNIAHDDCYIDAPAGLPAGKFRRSAALAGAIRRSSLDRIAGNPGQNIVPLVTLLGPDGLTRARDESTATTKLGRKSGKAWCLRSVNNQLGIVKFEVSPTGAGASSRFWDPGVVAIAFSMAAAACAIVQMWEGESWETDPESPAAVLPSFAEARANELAQALDDIARPKNKPPNISGNLHVVVSAPTLLNDGDVLAEVTFNPLGVPQSITIRITATGAVIQEAA